MLHVYKLRGRVCSVQYIGIDFQCRRVIDVTFLFSSPCADAVTQQPKVRNTTGFHQNRIRVSLLANSRHHFDSNVRGRHIIVSANIFSWKKEKAASRIFADCVVVLFGRRPECPGNKKGEKMFFARVCV